MLASLSPLDLSESVAGCRALAAQTYLPVTSYIIITLDLPQHDFDTNFGMAGPALTDDLCVYL